MSAQQGGRTET